MVAADIRKSQIGSARRRMVCKYLVASATVPKPCNAGRLCHNFACLSTGCTDSLTQLCTRMVSTRCTLRSQSINKARDPAAVKLDPGGSSELNRQACRARWLERFPHSQISFPPPDSGSVCSSPPPPNDPSISISMTEPCAFLPEFLRSMITTSSCTERQAKSFGGTGIISSLATYVVNTIVMTGVRSIKEGATRDTLM